MQLLHGTGSLAPQRSRLGRKLHANNNQCVGLLGGSASTHGTHCGPPASTLAARARLRGGACVWRCRARRASDVLTRSPKCRYAHAPPPHAHATRDHLHCRAPCLRGSLTRTHAVVTPPPPVASSASLDDATSPRGARGLASRSREDPCPVKLVMDVVVQQAKEMAPGNPTATKQLQQARAEEIKQQGALPGEAGAERGGKISGWAVGLKVVGVAPSQARRPRSPRKRGAPLPDRGVPGGACAARSGLGRASRDEDRGTQPMCVCRCTKGGQKGDEQHNLACHPPWSARVRGQLICSTAAFCGQQHTQAAETPHDQTACCAAGTRRHADRA